MLSFSQMFDHSRTGNNNNNPHSHYSKDQVSDCNLQSIHKIHTETDFSGPIPVSVQFFIFDGISETLI